MSIIFPTLLQIPILKFVPENKLDSILNKIVCDDANNFLKKLLPKSVDLVLTDPPYGVGISSWDDEAPLEWCKEIPRIMKDNASLLVFCGKQNRFEIEKTLRDNNLHFWQELIWVYGNGGVTHKVSYNGHHEPILWFVKDCDDFYFNIEGKKWIDTWTVIDRARPQKNYNCDKKIHPTQKALQVVKRLIEYHSKKDDVILDPYMGSATTAVACKLLGRNFVGCELDEGYVDLANKRLNETIQETFMESCKIVQ